jgi:hypothetical protein
MTSRTALDLNLGKLKKALDSYSGHPDAQQALLTRQIRGILRDLKLESRLETDSVFNVLQMAKNKLESTIKCADDITEAIDSIVDSLKHVTRDLTKDKVMSNVGFGDAAELLVFLNEQLAEGNTDASCLTPQVNVLIERLHSLGVLDKDELDSLPIDKKISSMVQHLHNYKQLIAAANIVHKRRSKVRRTSRVKHDKHGEVDQASAQALREFRDLGHKLRVPAFGKQQLLKALIHNLSLSKIERPDSSYEELMKALEHKFGVQQSAAPARRSRSRSPPTRSRSRSHAPPEPLTRSRSRSRTRAAQSPSPSATRESALKTLINNDEFGAAREFLKAYTREPNVTARDLKRKLHEVVSLLRAKIPKDADWQEWVASMNRTRERLKQGIPKADLKPAYKNAMNLLRELETRQTLVDQEPLTRILNKFKAIEEDDRDLIAFVKELQAVKLPAAVFAKAPSASGDELRRMLGVLRDKTRRRIENSTTRDALGRVENPLVFDALSDRLDTIVDGIKESQRVAQGVDAQRAHLRKALLELGRLLGDIEGEPLGLQLRRIEAAPHIDLDLLDRLKSLSDHPPTIVAGAPNAKQRELDASGKIGKSDVYWAMSHVLHLVGESIRSMKPGESRNRMNEWLNSVQNLRTNTQHDSKKYTTDFEVPSQGLAFLINEVLQLARFTGRSNLSKVREQDIKQAWHGQKTYLYPVSSRRASSLDSRRDSGRNSSNSRSSSREPTRRRKGSTSPQRPRVSELEAPIRSRSSSREPTRRRTPSRSPQRPLVSELEAPIRSRSSSREPTRRRTPSRSPLRLLVSDLNDEVDLDEARMATEAAALPSLAMMSPPRIASPQSPTLTYLPSAARGFGSPKPMISPRRESPKALISPRRESPKPLISPRRESPQPLISPRRESPQPLISPRRESPQPLISPRREADDYDPEYPDYNAVIREYSPTSPAIGNNVAELAEYSPTRADFQLDDLDRREYSPTNPDFQREGTPEAPEYSPNQLEGTPEAPDYSPNLE